MSKQAMELALEEICEKVFYAMEHPQTVSTYHHCLKNIGALCEIGLKEAVKQREDSQVPKDTHTFIGKTNAEHDAWLKTFYAADTDLEQFFLYSLWAWQEQERSKDLLRKRILELETLHHSLWEASVNMGKKMAEVKLSFAAQKPESS